MAEKTETQVMAPIDDAKEKLQVLLKEMQAKSDAERRVVMEKVVNLLKERKYEMIAEHLPRITNGNQVVTDHNIRLVKLDKSVPPAEAEADSVAAEITKILEQDGYNFSVDHVIRLAKRPEQPK